MKLALLVLAIFCLITLRAFPDSVTLNNGEVMRGDILSETDTDLVIMAVNQNRTISSRRTVLKSDIKTVDRESAQQKQERRAYEAIEDRLRLDPNREFSKTEYESGIDAFNNYLKTYPDSKFAGDVQKRLSLWKDELSHVEQGEVKFASKWMTPEQKKPQVLNKRLADLERQRDSLNAEVAGTQGKLVGLNTKLSTLARYIQQPDYQTRIVGPQHYSERYLAGYKSVPNAEWEKAQADFASYQQSIVSGRATLANLDAKIRSAKSELQQIQEAYEAALAKASAPPVQVAVEEPTPPPPPPPAAPKPKPWLARNWKGLTIGAVGILLLFAILARPVLRRIERAQAERDKHRRIAREHLKKIFDRIFVEGERPSGKNTPEGEIVSFGNGHIATGGERWFVIGPSYIWAVQNNGRDDDNWVLNNVETGGPGAIGARVMMEEEVVNSIKTLAQAGS